MVCASLFLSIVSYARRKGLVGSWKNVKPKDVAGETSGSVKSGQLSHVASKQYYIFFLNIMFISLFVLYICFQSEQINFFTNHWDYLSYFLKEKSLHFNSQSPSHVQVKKKKNINLVFNVCYLVKSVLLQFHLLTAPSIMRMQVSITAIIELLWIYHRFTTICDLLHPLVWVQWLYIGLFCP